MNPSNETLKAWVEQKQITVPSLFFKHYKEIGIRDDEALLLLQVIAVQEEGIPFPTPMLMSERTCFDANQVSTMYQRLIQKGFIELQQKTDEQGILYEKFSLYPLWEKIMHKIKQQAMVQSSVKSTVDERSIFTLIEQELGRLLSSIEIEQVSMWMDHDGHSPEIIKEAVKEAVLANKMSLRYVDRVLFEWKKKQLKTIEQVRAHAEEYRNYSMPKKQTGEASRTDSSSAARAGFYNWLDERE